MALIGPNGTGKTTLTRIVAGDLPAQDGVVTRSGGLAVMRQFIGSVRDDSTVRDLLVSVAPEPIRRAAAEIDAPSCAMMERDTEQDQLAYAQALVDWADVGGYEAETLWDVCTVAALGCPSSRPSGATSRPCRAGSRSGSSSRRCCADPRRSCSSTSRTTTSTSRPSGGSRTQLIASPRPSCSSATTVSCWTGSRPGWRRSSPAGPATPCGCIRGRFATYDQARVDRNERLEELRRRWDEEHAKLKALVRHVPPEGGIQLRHGRPAPGGRDPAAALRGRGPA